MPEQPLTKYQQELMDAANKCACINFRIAKADSMPRGYGMPTQNEIEEAKAAFRALVERAIDKEAIWFKRMGGYEGQ